MSGLEQIVRPFSRPNSLATRRIIATNLKIDVPDAILSWGASGTLPTAEKIEVPGPPNEDQSFVTRRHTEYDEQPQTMPRQTERVRIENPDDPTQYIIVDRVKQIGFEKNKNASSPSNDIAKYAVAYSESAIDPAWRSTDATGAETVRYNLAPTAA